MRRLGEVFIKTNSFFVVLHTACGFVKKSLMGSTVFE